MDLLSTSFSFIVATISVILAIFFIKFAEGSLKKRKRTAPVVGTIFNMLVNFNRLHDYMTEIACKHRTYRFLNLGRSEVYTSDPANVEYILKTNFENYGKNLFMKSTLDSVFKVVLGVDLDSMCGTNGGAGALFTSAFDEASAITLYRYVDVFWKIRRFLNIGSEAKLKYCIQVVDRFVYKLIRSKIEQAHSSQDGLQTKKGDILSRFLESNETDPKYLKDIILSFIIAGKDTTASTLSWFLYMMCKHPLAQERIAREVWGATKAKENSSFGELAASLSEEALEKMQYLHAALTETLRLYPAVPVDGKLCLSDDTLPDGVSVRRGDQVAYQPYAMGRMKWLWGDDAEEFRPQRWLNEDSVFQQESSFKFTAFQAGPRICLGKEFAYRQMKIFSALLISSFAFKLYDQNQAVNYKTMLTLHINGGLRLIATRRDQPCIESKQ